MKSHLPIILVTLLIWGCYTNKKTGILVVANGTQSPLTVVKQPDQIITDSLVFFDQLDKTEFIVGETKAISLPYSGFKSLPDSKKTYLYVFNSDSLDKWRNEKKIDGILKKCLIKTFSIQLNQVKDKLDTVYISR
ncbi:hypothetical protein [Pedobacter nutrimenti]|uniref:Uncharacterized protein n=1 Tax=Pedobacter nutrimenti TaxID=1241337 RepID=A0A318UCS3_9SPHI|nr:hypothetical protein [Pedobacter nutrimenti]PYF74194.1 hypothetical protein B0O44_104365 [Pedobacter nutrimenti]